MSTYESDPAGLGVGKRYGALEPGGIASQIGGVDASRQAVFVTKYGEDDGIDNRNGVYIPANARITKVEHNVLVAYDGTTPTVDVLLDGTTVLSAAHAIATIGYTDDALTATVANLLVGSTAEELKINIDDGGDSTEGEVVITVTYTTA